MHTQWRYIGDGMISVEIEGLVEFQVHHSQWHDPETRRIIVDGEIDNLRWATKLIE